MAITKKFMLDEDAIKEAIVTYLTHQDAYVKAENVKLIAVPNYTRDEQPTGTYYVTAEVSE